MKHTPGPWNYDESSSMTSSELWELLDDWEWDSLTGRFQDYLIALRQERHKLLEACEAALEWLSRFGEHSPIIFGGEPELNAKLIIAIAKAKGEK